MGENSDHFVVIFSNLESKSLVRASLGTSSLKKDTSGVQLRIYVVKFGLQDRIVHLEHSSGFYSLNIFLCPHY